MSGILSKIIEYESKVFDEYSSKRLSFLEHLKRIETNNLTQGQLLVFISDIKAIIDPLKTSNDAIEHYFTNTSFKKNNSINDTKNMLFYILLSTLISESLELDPELESDVTEESSESLESLE